MKQYDIGILVNHEDKSLIGSFGIIIEDYLKECFLVEMWNFEKFDGAKIDSLPKDYLRSAKEEEIKEYQNKFNEYCIKNDNSQI